MSGGVPGHDGKDPPQTLPEEVAPAVAELAGEGFGRNAIARALAVSTGTVSKAAQIVGVEFDRGPTEAATRTRSEQLADDRADLAGMSAEIARRAGRRLFMELGAEVLDPSAVTALNRVYGTAVDKSLSAGMLAPTNDQDELQVVRLWVESLNAQLRAAELGIIRPDENGNTPLVMSADQIPQDHTDDDHTTNAQEAA